VSVSELHIPGMSTAKNCFRHRCGVSIKCCDNSRVSVLRRFDLMGYANICRFAPRRARARMMAAVFSMQPLGQIFASIVGLAVLMTVGKSLKTETDHEKAATTVDRIWRWVIGVGAIPALVAIAFRLTIPESPRYTLDVEGDGDRAWRDAQRYYDTKSRAVDGQRDVERLVGPSSVDQLEDKGQGIQLDANREEIEPAPPRAEWKIFFIDQGNIKYLLGTSLCWFLLVSCSFHPKPPLSMVLYS
jgi:PHS family inorganic phosphate transporter-like MFS transporter